MNKMIFVKMMSDGAVSSLKHSSKKATEYIKSNDVDSSWINNIYHEKIFEDQKQQVEDFELQVSENGDFNEVALSDAIIIYEHLNKLPRRILCSENFWAWINMTIGYKAARQAMNLTSETTFKSHWLFNDGLRRSLFFGVLSRLYFWTELTVDESNKIDKYEYTKFVIPKIERIRNLCWRLNSNNKNLVLATVKAEKKLYDECKNDPEKLKLFEQAEKSKKDGNKNIYTEISKYISIYGGVHLLDAMSCDELESVVYKKLNELLYTVTDN